MLSDSELRLLDLALGRILPVDDGDAMRAYVRERAALQPDLYRAGLLVLASRGFSDLDDAEQTRTLTELEGHPSIALLIQHAAEGYYTSLAGYEAVGFRVTA